MSAVDDCLRFLEGAMERVRTDQDYVLYVPPALEQPAREALDKLVESGCYPLSVPTRIVVVGNKLKRK